MSALSRSTRKVLLPFVRPHVSCYCTAGSSAEAGDSVEEEDFDRMPFLPKQKVIFKRTEQYKSAIMAPRNTRMAIDQDWNAVWPAARTFNPSSLPLPIYMGYLTGQPRLGRYNNPELLKIPNFFHLTPPNIKKQCRALKKFCSPWPRGLETEEKIEKHFPIEIITKDYCHASPTIRDTRARIIQLKFKLSSLQLDAHARDKIIRLLANRYEPETDLVTIETSACPLKKQNIDYAFYQLTAVYYEAWKTEPWEEFKEPQDWERFFFEKSSSREKIVDLLKVFTGDVKDIESEKKDDLEEYGKALTALNDVQENDETIDAYSRSVTRLLFS